MTNTIKQIPSKDQNSNMTVSEKSENGILLKVVVPGSHTTSCFSGETYFIPLKNSDDIDPLSIEGVVAMIKNSDITSKNIISEDLRSTSYWILGYQFFNRKTYSLATLDEEMSERIFGREKEVTYFSPISDNYILLPGSRFINADEFEEICNGDAKLDHPDDVYEEGLAFENIGYVDLAQMGADSEFEDVIFSTSVEEYNSYFGFLLHEDLVLPFKQEEIETEEDNISGHPPHFPSAL